MIAVDESAMALVPAAMHIDADRMTVRVHDVELTAPVRRFANGERSGIATFAELAATLSSRRLVLRSCAGCKRFWFSGLSFQFSGGTRGYCALAAGRDPGAEVAIDFGCGEHQPIDGWPDDLATADRVRMEQRMIDPAPSRLPAIEGALLGLLAGASSASVQVAERALEVVQRTAAAVSERAGGHDGVPSATNRTAERNGELRGGDVVAAGTVIGLVSWRDPSRAAELRHAVTARGAGGEDRDVEVVATLVAMAMRKRTVEEMRRATVSVGPVDGAIEHGFEWFAAGPELFENVMTTSRAASPASAVSASAAGALAGAFNGAISIPDRWRPDSTRAEAAMAAARLLQIAGGTT